ncbi:hypothetical protein [Streptomyces sp. NPDC001966]
MSEPCRSLAHEPIFRRRRSARHDAVFVHGHRLRTDEIDQLGFRECVGQVTVSHGMFQRVVRDHLSNYVVVFARIGDGVLFETVLFENSPDWQTTW